MKITIDLTPAAVRFLFGKKQGWRNHIFWRATNPRSPLRIELMNLMKNIERDEQALDSMSAEFARNGGCCTSCMFGDRWYRVYERLQRRLERANQITRKLWYDAGNYGPLKPVWSSHT